MLRGMTMGAGSVARAAAALASGALVAVAFPPFGSADAAWFGFIPLLVLARFTPPAAAFRWGVLSGALFWLVSLGWLLNLFKTGGYLAAVSLGWVALAGYCALYTGAFTALVSGLWERDRERDRIDRETGDPVLRTRWAWTASRPLENVGRLLVIPLIWVGFEYLRGVLFSGFPWNGLGVSQFRNLIMIQPAEWGGVAAVSALVMLMNVALAMTGLDVAVFYANRGGARRRLHVELMLALAVWGGVWVWGVGRVRDLSRELGSQGEELRLALIQANIPQTRKWDESQAPDTLQRMCELTAQAVIAGPALVIWPETALPYDLRKDTDVVEILTDALGKGPHLLAGAIDVETLGEDRYRYYNASMLLNGEGRILESYRKQHLVPFGEFIPLGGIFPWLDRLAPLGFSCAAGTRSTLFRLPGTGAEFSALICFEDAFADLSRSAVRGGARMLVNQTNDAWFDRSESAAIQHLSHSVLRAVENRVAVARSANEGVSCVIDPLGRLDTVTGTKLRAGEALNTEYLVDAARLPPRSWAPTRYTRVGDAGFALPCAIGVLAGSWWLCRGGRTAPNPRLTVKGQGPSIRGSPAFGSRGRSPSTGA